MNRQIDLRSVLLGVLLASCVFLAIGSSSDSTIGRSGRYQAVAQANNYVYVLDTHSGRIWQKHPSRSEFAEMKIDTQPSVAGKR